MELILILFGLIVGSFVNALIYRVPRSLGMNGRSMCPSCKTTVAWYDLVPLFSFLFLRGRCRKCRQTISLTYPLVELLTAFSFWQIGRSFNLTFNNTIFLIYSLFLVSIFIALLFIDLKHYILPDEFIFSGFLVSIGFLIAFPQDIKEKIAGVILWGGMFFIIHLISKGKWMGFGDVKLAVLIGLVFGLLEGLFVVYLAIFAGFIVSIALMLTSRASLKTKIPFGSFLAGASIIFLLFGKITDSILRFLFL